MGLVFKGNFGELDLAIDGDKAFGSYQEGTLEGSYINGKFEGIWENKGLEGRVEFTIDNGKLNGTWKKGLEPGPMRGKWFGELIKDDTPSKSKNETINEWGIIHDIAVFYVFLGNLADGGAQEDAEWKEISERIQKWSVEVDNKRWGFPDNNPKSLGGFLDTIFDSLYMENGSAEKDPFIQVNESHSNLANYFNQGYIDCVDIKTFIDDLTAICTIRAIYMLQQQQLTFLKEQWSSVCSEIS